MALHFQLIISLSIVLLASLVVVGDTRKLFYNGKAGIILRDQKQHRREENLKDLINNGDGRHGKATSTNSTISKSGPTPQAGHLDLPVPPTMPKTTFLTSKRGTTPGHSPGVGHPRSPPPHMFSGAAHFTWKLKTTPPDQSLGAGHLGSPVPPTMAKTTFLTSKRGTTPGHSPGVGHPRSPPPHVF
ncbi:hypothetical protein SAY86_013394 [Trapa natans]|uniref:Uncharacterized protein n=1 Tax=Trapa natans TaxID=22666 RepID=A0AAN7MEF8_TRANT|nr:hypothetical protein SAY86_013394 [Trapa natans]